MRILFMSMAGFMIWLCGAGGFAKADLPPHHVLPRGGLAVWLACGDADQLAELRAKTGCVVQDLEVDDASVRRLRESLYEQRLYGPISVEAFDGRNLPYVDDLVNLLIADNPNDVPLDELDRVLAPGGVAVVAGKVTVKPWPGSRDDWSHYLHGPDNNAVAEDTVVGPPRYMQWLAGPRWTRHHHADKGTDPTVRAIVSAAGRLFYAVDETATSDRTVPCRWMLMARDAFSGVTLWKKPMKAVQFTRDLQLLWRGIVADEENVYTSLGPDEPLCAWDGATGKHVRTYQDTVGFREVILSGNTLFVVNVESTLQAHDRDTGDIRWRWQPASDDAIVPVTLAADEGRVFVKTERGVQCLDGRTGTSLWRVELPMAEKPVRLRWPRERLLVKHGVVLCSFGGKDPRELDRDTYEFLGSHPRVRVYQGRLAALSAETGERLWEAPYYPGLESTPGEIYIRGNQVWLGPEFASPRSLETGEVLFHRPVLEQLWTDGHHYRCYPGKATSRYILSAKRGIELIDLQGDQHWRNNWVRATCRVGILPCNGLIYAPPHSCGCYMESKLYGFWALAAPEARQPVAPIEPLRLQRGAAYEMHEPIADDGELWWPTYRGSNDRSGAVSMELPSPPNVQWKASLGGRLTAPTVAGNRVFVAQIDRHTVHALDALTGRRLWHFIAGGRIDSPPTVASGCVVFGCHDGSVYCLRASDGELAWRFLAAPALRRVVAENQLASPWPIPGSVLVRDGMVYFAAGHGSYLDGGIHCWAIDLKTGRQRFSRDLADPPVGAMAPPAPEKQSQLYARIRQNTVDYKTIMAPDHSDGFSMSGALNDVLVAQNDAIFMRQLRFDERLTPVKQKIPHLFSTSSLLDDYEHNRSYWVYGTGDFRRTPVAYPWIVSKSLAVPSGVLLAFDGDRIWGVQREEPRGKPFNYVLFEADRPTSDDPESGLPDFEVRSGGRSRPTYGWREPLSIRPRAMVKGGDRLMIVGAPWPPVTADENASSSLESSSGPRIEIRSCRDGSLIHQQPIDASAVWDGLALADGKVFMADERGTVVCYGRGNR